MREDISFKTVDGVILRGWMYRPDDAGKTELPCLVMCHGFSGVKEMYLDKFADHFVSQLPVSCLIYDNRGFGDSDTKEGAPRHEIIAPQQISDFSDAITYAQSRSDVLSDKIGIWGSSFGGGHALHLGATDKRVKAVLSQVPCVDGYAVTQRLVRADFMPKMNEMFQQDRLGRAVGQAPMMMPIVTADPQAPAAMPTPDAWAFFAPWTEKSSWKNEVTLKSLESCREYHPSAHIHRVTPTPSVGDSRQQ